MRQRGKMPSDTICPFTSVLCVLKTSRVQYGPLMRSSTRSDDHKSYLGKWLVIAFKGFNWINIFRPVLRPRLDLPDNPSLGMAALVSRCTYWLFMLIVVALESTNKLMLTQCQPLSTTTKHNVAVFSVLTKSFRVNNKQLAQRWRVTTMQWREY